MRMLASLILSASLTLNAVGAEDGPELTENKTLESPQLFFAAKQPDNSVLLSWMSLPNESAYMVWREITVNYRMSNGQLTKVPPTVELIPWGVTSLWIEVEVNFETGDDGRLVRRSQPTFARIPWNKERPLPANTRVFAQVLPLDPIDSTWGVSSVQSSSGVTQYSPPALIAVSASPTSVESESWGNLKRRVFE